MKIFKEKMYTVFELGVLKVCVLCVGLILGACLAPHIKRYLWIFAALGVATYIRAMHYYWRD